MTETAAVTHHPDCDGWRTSHRHVTEHTHREHGIRRLVCVECGNVSPQCGPGVTDASLRGLIDCHSQEVPCSGDCVSWD